MRRHYYLNNPVNGINYYSGKIEPLEWIESVGNSQHVLYPYYIAPASFGPLNTLDYWHYSKIMCKYTDSSKIYFDNQIYNGIMTGSIGCYGTFDSCHHQSICGSIAENMNLNDIKIFPQPADDKITLSGECK